MVGPISSEERSRLMLQLKAVFVVVIGASAGLITLLGETTLLETALVTGVGLVFGVLIVWFVFPGTGEVKRTRR
ncbi:hypothetical protein ACFPYI_16820 [Halomarina salina]|uniref:Major facilitator superfamily (MFS) profile domain-containing protein n=1 Tax=Halomarina salina TaxID=1872699 RepID=A0ABD5RRQ4_9EURY|nr:hypothetical protein [Halomarina salina]